VHFFVAGSAVLLFTAQQGKPHVWFILTDPDGDNRVLAVMLVTRRRHTDETTILAPGEYPFGNPVEGAIAYGETKLFPVNWLTDMVRKNKARMCEPLSSELLARVLAGIKVSGHVPNWVGEYFDP